MRKLIIFIFTALQCSNGFSQPVKAGISSQFSENLNKIVLDFRYNYYNIQGENLHDEGDTRVYRSVLTVPGSLSASIYRFGPSSDSTAGWQALLYQGDAYEDAVKVYKNTSRQLNKCRLVLGNRSGVGFNGKLHEPDPGLSFASSSFKLNSDDKVYDKFYADIEMVNTGIESWEVRLNLHNRKDDTDKY